MNEAFAVLLGLLTGSAMSVAVSCVWGVLLIPARVQDVLRAGTPRLLTWAICLGLALSTLHDMLGAALPLPLIFGSAALLLSGMFVGMLSAALEEILEVAPVIMRRFRLARGEPPARPGEHAPPPPGGSVHRCEVRDDAREGAGGDFGGTGLYLIMKEMRSLARQPHGSCENGVGPAPSP